MPRISADASSSSSCCLGFDMSYRAGEELEKKVRALRRARHGPFGEFSWRSRQGQKRASHPAIWPSSQPASRQAGRQQASTLNTQTRKHTNTKTQASKQRGTPTRKHANTHTGTQTDKQTHKLTIQANKPHKTTKAIKPDKQTRQT